MTLNNYKDVQDMLSKFVASAGVPIGSAPHKSFWNTMTYEQFTTGNVPLPPSYPVVQILVKGDSKSSAIVQILSGTGQYADDFGQMPQPSPPYNSATPPQSEVITSLAAWIDAGCPN